MSGPKRIQRKRTKGWRMPEGAVYVGRPGVWGNPWTVDDFTESIYEMANAVVPPRDVTKEWARRVSADVAVAAFREAVLDDRAWQHPGWYPSVEEIRTALAGKDLACWCPLEDEHGNRFPCHADVLLEIANRGDGQ